MTTILQARVDRNGKVVWRHPSQAIAFFRSMKERRISITVGEPGRSLDQNAAFHALCGDLADYTGYSPAAWKEHFKRSYLSQEGRSSADLSEDEMGGLIEHSYYLAAEYNLLERRRARRVA